MTYQKPSSDESSSDGSDIEANYDLSSGPGNNAGATTSVGDEVDYGYDLPSKAASSAEDSVDGHSTDIDEIERKQEAEEKRSANLLAKLRIIIIFGLVLLMLATSSVVYAFGVSKKNAAFSARFRSEGARTIDSIQSALSQKIVALDSLSTILTTMAEIQNYTWPFVTFSDRKSVV